MVILVIFGGPGSGKGTQSQKLSSEYGLFHISTGEVLREHIALGDEFGQIANSYISKGQLIPDDLMLKVLYKQLDMNRSKTKRGIIFDGFPRTVEQAINLKQMLANYGQRVNGVIGLEVDDEILTERLLERGKLTGRADDNVETIKQRLEVYHNQTQPLRDYYIGEGKYLPIEGNGTVDEVFENIRKTLIECVPEPAV